MYESKSSKIFEEGATLGYAAIGGLIGGPLGVFIFGGAAKLAAKLIREAAGDNDD